MFCSAVVRILSFRAHHWNEVEPLSKFLLLDSGSVTASTLIDEWAT